MNDPTDQDYPALSVSRKQMRSHDGRFMYEADQFQGEYAVSLSIATKASTAIGTITTGKKLHIRTVMISQVTRTAPRYYKIKNGSGVTIMGIGLGTAATSFALTGIEGITATTALYVSKSSKATGVVTIGGILDPQDDGY